jgi:hypothetical protein
MKTKFKNIQESEPTWNSLELDVQLPKILNWYSYNKTNDDAKKYFIDFLISSGEKPDVIKKIESQYIRSSIGWLSRIVTVNTNVPELIHTRIQDEKIRLLNSNTHDDTQKILKDTSSITPKKLTIQDHLDNQFRILMGQLDFEIDNFLLNKCSSTFNCAEWLQTNDVKFQQSQRLSSHLAEKCLKELQEALDGKCPQLCEAYSFLSKDSLKKFITFIHDMKDSCDKWSNASKQIQIDNRSIRIKKPKPPLKQIEKLNYLKQHEKLESIPPVKIIGATQLWIFNVKTRMLGVYNCTNSHGFEVKGSTILNFDVKTSVAKKLRKPSEILDKVLSAGKVAARRIIPDIKAKENQLNGRINKDTILVKVF